MMCTCLVAEERKSLKIRMSVEFIAEELKEVVSSEWCDIVQRRARHVSILPKYLGDTKSAIKSTLNSVNKFDIR
jgi:hypothetical protein